MPKRKNKDEIISDDYILSKIKRLEKKLRKRCRKTSSNSPKNSNMPLSLQEENVQNVYVDQSTLEAIDDGIITSDLLSSDIQDSSLQVLESEVPTTSAESNEPELTLDDSILELLGETPSKNRKFSSPIQNELAVCWEFITINGLSKVEKKELLDKYFLPENCLKIGSPQLNPEIKAALSEALTKKDKAIEIKQNQQAIALSCIGHALSRIFKSENKDKETIKLLVDAGKLICDYQHVESMSRRAFATCSLRKDLKDQLYATEIDSFLFGEKLAETLKAGKAISKSGAEMKTALTAKFASQSRFQQSQSLNVKPPLPSMRQAGVGRRPAAAMLQPRRYQGPPLPLSSYPPAKSAHQAPPPPPAQQQRSRERTRIHR